MYTSLHAETNTHRSCKAARAREPYPETNVTFYASEMRYVLCRCSDSGNVLPLEEVFIGYHAMKNLKDEVALTTSDIRQFRENCQAWRSLLLRKP